MSAEPRESGRIAWFVWFAPILGPWPGVAGDRRAEFFDDFSYVSFSDPADPSNPVDPRFASFGWEARGGTGGPGPAGAAWRRDYLVWEDDALLPGNRVMRLRASTAGTAETSQQSEARTVALRFHEGTYCSRVLLTDAPRLGTPQPSVQTFFAVNTLDECDLDYSETDFEYLPNDNFGDPCSGGQVLHMTTWETWNDAATNPPQCSAAAEPLSTVRCGPLEGWHMLCFQVTGGQVRYFLDGVELAGHGGAHYPETVMRISFNHWFVASGLAPADQPQEYSMAVDWIYHARNAAVDPADVLATIEALRTACLPRLDTLNCSATAGDLDWDGDVDLTDYGPWAECLAGPDGGISQVSCGCADLDGDYDVDLADFARLQQR